MEPPHPPQFLDRFVRPDRLLSGRELRDHPQTLPQLSGLYGWWFNEVLPGVPLTKTASWQGKHLLYAGISPGRAGSKAHLRSRIVGCHFRGNASGSTLRLTLGCLLSDALSLELQPTGSKGRLTFGNGKRRLTEWMAANAFVSWVAVAEPWMLEEYAIRSLTLPLNLDRNQACGFHGQLSALRSRLKAVARRGGGATASDACAG